MTYIPIGKLLIKHEIDISKTINKIHYGYNYFIEEKSYIKQPMLSRKHKICYKKEAFIVIKEFFSKKLTNIIN